MVSAPRGPEEVTSDSTDRGPQFVSNFMCSLSEILWIKITASMAYHPQMDGQTEHVNQKRPNSSYASSNQRQDDWYDWISIAEFTYVVYTDAHIGISSHSMTCGTSMLKHWGLGWG